MDIKPFKGIVYNQKKVDIKNVIAPPYDVIGDEYLDELYAKDPYNIVRLILTKGENRYEDAKKYYDLWQKEDILVETANPSIFYTVQKYKTASNKTIERKGFIARCHIESFESKKVLPHEYTMGGPKEDRLKLTRALDANLSQIFMVYNDEKLQIETSILPKYLNKKPFIDVFDDMGVEHIVYIIDDVEDIEFIQKVLKDKTVLIADGHHRYETAMNYSKESKNPIAQYVMSYFTNAKDENLIVFPTHRIITKEIGPNLILNAVKKHYDVVEMPFDTDKDKVKAEFLSKIEELNKNKITTGLYLKGVKSFFVLTLKDSSFELIDAPYPLKKLDLTALHELIITSELSYTKEEQTSQTGIKYIKQEFEAFDMVEKNQASASFIMAYPKMEDIENVSQMGYRMPQKSTYFYPKLLSGVVINPLNK